MRSAQRITSPRQPLARGVLTDAEIGATPVLAVGARARDEPSRSTLRRLARIVQVHQSLQIWC